MFQGQILVAKFYKITWLKLHPGQAGNIDRDDERLSQRYVTIPCEILFPAQTRPILKILLLKM